MIRLSAIFILTWLLTACSMLGLELGTHRTVAIEKAPVRIVLSGDIDRRDWDEAYRMLKQVQSGKYYDHKMEPYIVHVHGTQQTLHTVTHNNEATATVEKEDRE